MRRLGRAGLEFARRSRVSRNRRGGSQRSGLGRAGRSDVALPLSADCAEAGYSSLSISRCRLIMRIHASATRLRTGGTRFCASGTSGSSSLRSLLLQRHAVNLINPNTPADKVPIFLVFKRAFALRPPEVAWSFRMIWIVNKVAINPRWARFPCIKKNGVINPQVRQSGEKTNEQIAAIQNGTKFFVRSFLIPGAR